MRTRLLSCLMAALTCCFVFAADSVRTGTLSNGITYYVGYNASPANRADFFLARSIGSVVEEENERGLAHFLEHMCFNGTEHFPGNSLISYLESIGVKFGTNLNAYTSTDETVYNISKVPVSRQTVIDSCLLIMRDWSCALTLTDEDINAERGVIVNEWRQRNTAANRMLEKAAPRLYPGSRYGVRLPIGKMEVVEKFDPQTLRDFYNKWHRTDNEAVIVVGDVDVDGVVAKIEELFGSIQPSAVSDVRSAFDVPDTPELITVVQSDPEQGVNMLQLHFKHRKSATADASNMWREEIVSDLMTSMLAGRFDAIEADPDCPYHHLGIGDMKYFLSRPMKSLMFRGISHTGREAETLKTWYSEVVRALRYGFLPGELALAKTEAAKKLASSRKRTRSNTDIAKDYVRHYLDGCGVVPSDGEEIDAKEKILESVTADEVTSFLRSIVKGDGSNTAVLLYRPEDKTSAVSDNDMESALRTAFADVKSMDLEPYSDISLDGPILAKEPVAGRIVAADSLPQFDAELFTLSNGVKVYARRNTARSGQIFVRGVSPGGLSMRYSVELIPSMKLINEAMAVSRYGEYTASELNKLCAGRDIAVTTDIDITKETVEIATSPQDMRDAFRLMYLKMTDARPDADAFTIMQRTMVSTLGRKYDNPTQAMGDSIHRNVYSHHPLGAKTTASVAAAADYDTILELYRDRFADVSDFTFYVAGDYDADSLRACLESYVASLPAAGRMEKVRDIGYRFTPGSQDMRFYADMQTPQAIVYTFHHGPSKYDVSTAVTATALGRIVKSRLLADLRETRGWVYSVTGHCSALPSMNDYDPSSFLFPIYIKTAPEHADETAEVVISTISDVAENGVTSEELGKVKEYLLKSSADNGEDNAYWLSVFKVFNDNGIDMNAEFPKAVEAMTPGDVAAFAREVVLKGDRTRLMMLPK